MKRNISCFLLNIVSLVALLGGTGGQAEEITHNSFDNVDQWLIREPIVNLPLKPGTTIEQGKYYNQIGITGGDTILVSAGGCVQTGGHGLTWKRYVDPQGPNSDRLYHGRITLPGLHEMRIEDFMNQYGGTWLAPGTRGEYVILPHLSYEDDGPSDNGYTAHDNGTGNQCLNVGSAWVSITLIHQPYN
jgi:hypothetical protein